jgi:uncharacterized protein YegP (UPF0339 family)
MKFSRGKYMKLKQERFEYGCTNNDEWHFQLKSPKGKLILHCDAYETEAECRKIINAVKQYAISSEIIQVDTLEQY